MKGSIVVSFSSFSDKEGVFVQFLPESLLEGFILEAFSAHVPIPRLLHPLDGSLQKFVFAFRIKCFSLKEVLVAVESLFLVLPFPHLLL